MTMNKRVLLKSRPKGWVSEADFEFAEAPVPQPSEGQVLVRNHWLSLDPYMRGRMNDTKSYAAKAEIGEVMLGGTVGEVLETRDPSVKKGDFVVGALGWQQYGAAPAKAFRVIDTKAAPAQAYLGAIGMPGVTAWIGLLTIGEPKPERLSWSRRRLAPSARSSARSRSSRARMPSASPAAPRNALTWSRSSSSTLASITNRLASSRIRGGHAERRRRLFRECGRCRPRSRVAPLQYFCPHATLRPRLAIQ